MDWSRFRRAKENNYRQYNEPELSRLSVIRILRQAGYSMMSLLRVIHRMDLGFKNDLGTVLGDPPMDEDVVTVADRWLATLKEQKNRGEAIIITYRRDDPQIPLRNNRQTFH